MAGDIPAPKSEEAISAAEYETFTCDAEHVHVTFKRDGQTHEFLFDADDAYAFAQDVLRAYDEAVGITPPGE